MFASEYSSMCSDGWPSIEFRKRFPQRSQLHVRGAAAGQAGRHAFQRRPGVDHADDLALVLLDDEHAAPRFRTDEAFLLQNRQGLAHGRPADAEILRQLPLVQPHLVRTPIDVHVGDGGLERFVRQGPKTGAGDDRLNAQRFGVRHPASSRLTRMISRTLSLSCAPKRTNPNLSQILVDCGLAPQTCEVGRSAFGCAAAESSPPSAAWDARPKRLPLIQTIIPVFFCRFD